MSAATAQCPWYFRTYPRDAAGLVEAHRRLSVGRGGPARLVPCIAPSLLRAMGILPSKAPVVRR